MSPKSQRNIILVVTALWLAGIFGGSMILVAYSNNAGTTAEAPRQLPPGVVSEASRKPYTLMMFVHPQCPCSRSSLRELAMLMGTCEADVEATVFFYNPTSRADDWSHTDLWTTAERIAGTSNVSDPDGETARRFSARTSGQVLLYRRNGELLFSGGITAGRGHEGSNIGTEAVLRIVSGERASFATTPVFGCDIYKDTPKDTKSEKAEKTVRGGVECRRM